MGTDLGIAPNSNEVYVATVDGDVTKTRSVARVVEASKWDPKAIEKIHGVPGKTTSIPIAHADHPHLEEHLEPHIDGDAADRDAVDREDGEARNDFRITDRDLRLYGYHPGCPRCEAARAGQGGRKGFKPHSAECRWRLYEAWRDNHDKKFRYVEHLFKEPAQAVPVNVGAEGLDLEHSPAADPVTVEPLREDDLRPPDEPDHSGRWNPGVHQEEPEQPSLAAQDANDPSVDVFLPDDDDEDLDGMDLEDVDSRMIDKLRLAGVSEEAAFKFLKAIR